MLSRTGRSSTKPPVISISGATPRRTATRPSSGSITSATSFSSVDLPWPLRPTTPMDSPCCTSNDTLRSAQNSSGFFRRSPVAKRSLKLRERCRFRLKRMPTSSTEMTGVATSDLLQHARHAAPEDDGADREQDQGDDRGLEHVDPVEHVREEAGTVQLEEPDDGVEPVEEVQGRVAELER